MIRREAAVSEPVVAARNAVTLGGSLAMTAALSLGIRLLVPRFLGTTAFGQLRLAESFGELLFVVLTLGVDMQLRREAAVDPSRAGRYLSGLTALRVGLGVAASLLAAAVLRGVGAEPSLVALFAVTSAWQVLLALNNSYAALEHATGKVRWVARANVGAKVIWAAATLAVLAGWPNSLAVAGVAMAVEGLRLVCFAARGRRAHRVSWRPDFSLVAASLLASFPYFINAVAHTLYARIGIGWLGAVSGAREVGLYAAASSVAGVALLGMPLLSWVLVPSMARAVTSSRDDMHALVAGALRVSLLAAVPLALALYAGATPILSIVFGPEFGPAASVLRILAPTFALAYVAAICAMALIQEGKAWSVATVSLAGVAVTVALNAALIPWGARTLGEAGGAQGAAWATLVTEVVVTTAMAALSRRSWREARLQRTALALGGGVAAVVMAQLVPFPGTVAVGIVAVALAGAVDRADLAFLRQVLNGSGGAVGSRLAGEAS